MPQVNTLQQTQSQTQGLTLSPQQVMALKLIELPTVEFEEKVRAELIENPALEEGKEETLPTEENTYEEDSAQESVEDWDLGDYRTEDDIPDYKLREDNYSTENKAENIPFSDSVSFYETLLQQLDMQDLSAHEWEIGEYIIGSLDDDGWLRKSIESIVDELTIYRGIETDVAEVEHVLHTIQDFDPAGIGARDLKECLLLQIERKTDSPIKDLAYKIISKYTDDFTHKRKERLMASLGIDEATYTEVWSELTKLNPRPGSSMGEVIGKNLQQITPDFIVETDTEGGLSLTLNGRNVPELRLSQDFLLMIEEYSHTKKENQRESREALLFLKQKIESAQNFINAVKQRRETLTATMTTILELQKNFFVEGDESVLRPMILKDVADRTGLDISTISRVSNSKYVQTDFGIFPLKYFFSDGYTTAEGEELSVKHIKRILKETIETENKNEPYTDEELVLKLKEQGFDLARRTIAKYRQQLQIPVARLRK
ncbi:MAG: RNA polymerase factor sigma-54 [Phocaeicola sp.]|nr:RNA polymerase factor sigma-54 [Phocaeicola sp.]MDD7448812.1 RNA polymerase factor sigma-54 [Prevotellaceae bacterium]MDY5939043.1 RNA polymerase factor sigma-54 [Phocaeicola sp.]